MPKHIGKRLQRLALYVVDAPKEKATVATGAKMTRMRRIAGYVLAGVLSLGLVAWFSWRPLLRHWIVRDYSSSYFREQFRPHQGMYVCMAEDSWAWNYFGGTKGLPLLRDLSRDESLAPCGRSLASNLIDRISSGEHLKSFEEMTRGGNWFYRNYLEYIRDQDLGYLKRKSSLEPSAFRGPLRSFPNGELAHSTWQKGVREMSIPNQRFVRP